MGSFFDTVGDVLGVSVGGSSQKGSTTSFNAMSQDILDQFTQQAFQNYMTGNATAQQQYSKEAALTDTKGLVDSFIRQLTEQQLPALVGAESAAGAYGSTATQALKNDAVARTAEATARAQIEAIGSYANLLQGMQGTGLQELIQALGLQKGANVSMTGSESGMQTGWGAGAQVQGSYGKMG